TGSAWKRLCDDCIAPASNTHTRPVTSYPFVAPDESGPLVSSPSVSTATEAVVYGLCCREIGARFGVVDLGRWPGDRFPPGGGNELCGRKPCGGTALGMFVSRGLAHPPIHGPTRGRATGPGAAQPRPVLNHARLPQGYTVSYPIRQRQSGLSCSPSPLVGEGVGG